MCSLAQIGERLGKLGFRFSRKLAMPSVASAVSQPMNSSASDASKFGPIMRSQLLSAYLVKLIAVRAPFASFDATSRLYASSLSSSTQSETRPMRSASSPVSVSQVSR